MPEDIKEAFIAEHKISREEVLEAVYRKSLPNKYLASFSLFASQHIEHPYIRRLLSAVFSEFVEWQICKYPDYQNKEVHFVGSVAFVYQSIIKEVAQSKNIRCGNFLKSPAQALANYHLSEYKKTL